MPLLPMRAPEVLVVGAGPHALTAASYLLRADPALSGRIAAADGAPWLTSWRRRFTRLALAQLRSAAVHHPEPEPYALIEFARRTGRAHELTGEQGQPTTELFADFCDALLERNDLVAARIPIAVDALEPRSDGKVDVLLGGRVLRVGHVVLATGGACPHVPLLGARHADTVRLDQVRSGQHVCIVGGGLTAAHLALGAARRGAQVLLVARAPLQARAMDVEAVWLGHALPAFASGTPVQRAAAVRQARTGTVPPQVLTALQAQPQVRLHVGTVRQAGRDFVLLDDDRRLPVDAVWLATGHTHDVRADPLTAGLLRRVPLALADGLPVLDDDLSWGGSAVHVTGPLTALQVGPAARNLVGARMAAERYVGCVSGQWPVRLQYPSPAHAAY